MRNSLVCDYRVYISVNGSKILSTDIGQTVSIRLAIINTEYHPPTCIGLLV